MWTTLATLFVRMRNEGRYFARFVQSRVKIVYESCFSPTFDIAVSYFIRIRQIYDFSYPVADEISLRIIVQSSPITPSKPSSGEPVS